MADDQPIIVRRDMTSRDALCQSCVAEKNAPHESGRQAWARNEGHEDVTVRAELPLDQDEAWVECPHGHRHLVLREGSERAAQFGL
jgi:hypothetical protein